MLATILLVAADPSVLYTLIRTLKGEFRPILAATGKYAFELLRTQMVQAIVSDIILDDMHGFELCAKIRANVDLSHIPVILLVPKDAQHAKQQGFESGADAYIEKPFPPELFIAQLHSVLGNRELVRQHFARSPLAAVDIITDAGTDSKFQSALHTVIEANLDNPELDIDMLARLMNISRATLYRKIKVLSDVSPIEFIMLVRLKKAAALLTETDQRIYEVAMLTGFSTRGSFTRNFCRQFKQTPSDFARKRMTERGGVPLQGETE